jgi:hypothetical protein
VVLDHVEDGAPALKTAPQRRKALNPHPKGSVEIRQSSRGRAYATRTRRLLRCVGAHEQSTTKTKTRDVQIERLVCHRADKRELAETALTLLHAVKESVDYRVRR